MSESVRFCLIKDSREHLIPLQISAHPTAAFSSTCTPTVLHHSGSSTGSASLGAHRSDSHSAVCLSSTSFPSAFSPACALTTLPASAAPRAVSTAASSTAVAMLPASHSPSAVALDSTLMSESCSAQSSRYNTAPDSDRLQARRATSFHPSDIGVSVAEAPCSATLAKQAESAAHGSIVLPGSPRMLSSTPSGNSSPFAPLSTEAHKQLVKSSMSDFYACCRTCRRVAKALLTGVASTRRG